MIANNSSKAPRDKFASVHINKKQRACSSLCVRTRLLNLKWAHKTNWTVSPSPSTSPPLRWVTRRHTCVCALLCVVRYALHNKLRICACNSCCSTPHYTHFMYTRSIVRWHESLASSRASSLGGHDLSAKSGLKLLNVHAPLYEIEQQHPAAAVVVASAAAAQLRIEYLLCVCVRYVLWIKSKHTRTQLKVEYSLVPVYGRFGLLACLGGSVTVCECCGCGLFVVFFKTK